MKLHITLDGHGDHAIAMWTHPAETTELGGGRIETVFSAGSIPFAPNAIKSITAKGADPRRGRDSAFQIDWIADEIAQDPVSGETTIYFREGA